MARTSFPRHAARALFLQRQHLARPRAAGLTAARLSRFVEDVGGIQLDSINVLDRAHYLTVWSRFGPYDRAALDRLIYRRRLLFEYWAHAACLVPTTALPWWRRAMLDYRVRHTGWSDWLRRNTKVLARVRDAVTANGPLGNADFEGKRRPGAGGWWDWKPVQHALHYLWMTGTLTVHSRRHFHKRYDLLERALPGRMSGEPVSGEAFARWHIERSLHAMGAATETDLRGYLTFPRWAPGVRKTALHAMLAEGEVMEIAIEGFSTTWLALTRDLPALARAVRSPAPSRGTTLLAPFDSLLWYRERVSRLFGFDYRIEVYTPGDQRVHGYYTLPILHDGLLIGRVDAKTHRAEGRLEVRHVHFEPWFAAGKPAPMGGAIDRDAALAGVGEALGSLGTFVDATDVVMRRVTPGKLRAPLARGLRPPTPASRPARRAALAESTDGSASRSRSSSRRKSSHDATAPPAARAGADGSALASPADSP